MGEQGQVLQPRIVGMQDLTLFLVLTKSADLQRSQ